MQYTFFEFCSRCNEMAAQQSFRKIILLRCNSQLHIRNYHHSRFQGSCIQDFLQNLMIHRRLKNLVCSNQNLLASNDLFHQLKYFLAWDLCIKFSSSVKLEWLPISQQKALLLSLTKKSFEFGYNETTLHQCKDPKLSSNNQV